MLLLQLVIVLSHSSYCSVVKWGNQWTLVSCIDVILVHYSLLYVDTVVAYPFVTCVWFSMLTSVMSKPYTILYAHLSI